MRDLLLCLQSQSSLEMALSRSFEVKNRPLYHLISGRVQRALGHAPDALASLQTALKLSKVRRSQPQAGLGLSEMATVYLELVAVLTKLGRQVSTNFGLLRFSLSPSLSLAARSSQDDAGCHSRVLWHVRRVPVSQAPPLHPSSSDSPSLQRINRQRRPGDREGRCGSSPRHAQNSHRGQAVLC